MPKEAEFHELIDQCTWTWTDGGFKVTGPNGKYIFLPAVGIFNGSSVSLDYKQGRYWSADVNIYKDTYYAEARALQFTQSTGDHFMGKYLRYIGSAIRPVQDK